jgi:hypothetical protein
MTAALTKPAWKLSAAPYHPRPHVQFCRGLHLRGRAWKAADVLQHGRDADVGRKPAGPYAIDVSWRLSFNWTWRLYSDWKWRF